MSAFRVAGLLACVWLVAGVELAGAEENWPRFRGVDGNSVVADDSRLPEVWDRKTNVAWKAEIPGLGWGSPIVWGDRVYVSSVHSDARSRHPTQFPTFPLIIRKEAV